MNFRYGLTSEWTIVSLPSSSHIIWKFYDYPPVTLVTYIQTALKGNTC